jgi:hypothetical protein
MKHAACNTQTRAGAPESQRSQSSAMVRGAKNCKRRAGSHGVRAPFHPDKGANEPSGRGHQSAGQPYENKKGTRGKTTVPTRALEAGRRYAYMRGAAILTVLPSTPEYSTLRNDSGARRACTKKSRNSHDVRLLYANCLMYACAATRSRR